MRKRKHDCVRRVAIAVVVAALLPTPAWAGKLTCLTGTDPAVANDAAQIAAVRAVVEAACRCADYDGSPGRAHGSYISCAGRSINTEVGAGHLRGQCKATVKKYYAKSTCGVLASKGVAPCIKKTVAATSKVTCAITPSTKCVATDGTSPDIQGELRSLSVPGTDRETFLTLPEACPE